MHFYAFNIGDYMRETQHLTPMEDIAYRRLLDLYYSREHPFNERSTELARRVRLVDHEPAVRTVLEEFFTLEDDGCYHNRRADAEIAEAQDKQAKAVRAGKASGIARRKAAQHTLNGCSTNAELAIPPNPNPTPSPNPSRLVDSLGGSPVSGQKGEGVRTPVPEPSRHCFLEGCTLPQPHAHRVDL